MGFNHDWELDLRLRLYALYLTHANQMVSWFKCLLHAYWSKSRRWRSVQCHVCCLLRAKKISICFAVVYRDISVEMKSIFW